MVQHTEPWIRKKIVILWVGLILLLIAMVLVGEGSGTILLSGREQTSLADDVRRADFCDCASVPLPEPAQKPAADGRRNAAIL